MAAQTYQDEIAPRSSFPGSSDRCVGVLGVGDGAHDALGLRRARRSSRTPTAPTRPARCPTSRRAVARGVELGEVSSSSLAAPAASPPMSEASPARSCGTDHVYWTALPSSKPGLPARLELGGLEGLARGEAAVGAAGLDVAGRGVEEVLPVGRALEHRRGHGRSCSAVGDAGDGEVVEGVLERGRAADGVVDGGQVERPGVDVVLRSGTG